MGLKPIDDLADLLVGVSPDEVLRRHGEHVYRLLKRMFGPGADVDDLYQQVFVEVFASLPTFARRARLSTWVHRIALNVAYDEMRRRYRSVQEVWMDTTDGSVGSAPGRAAFDPGAGAGPLGDDAVVSGALAAAVDAHAEVERKDAQRLLYEGLAQLEAKRRIAVVLHDIVGMTLREIGERQGIPLQTVASQLHAGRADLGAWMRRRCAAPPALRERKRGDA